MKNYKVYFEFMGKKMKTTILADSKVDAENKMYDEFKLHKVEEMPKDEFNQVMDILGKFTDFLDTKKL